MDVDVEALKKRLQLFPPGMAEARARGCVCPDERRFSKPVCLTTCVLHGIPEIAQVVEEVRSARTSA